MSKERPGVHPTGIVSEVTASIPAGMWLQNHELVPLIFAAVLAGAPIAYDLYSQIRFEKERNGNGSNKEE